MKTRLHIFTAISTFSILHQLLKTITRLSNTGISIFVSFFVIWACLTFFISVYDLMIHTRNAMSLNVWNLHVITWVSSAHTPIILASCKIWTWFTGSIGIDDFTRTANNLYSIGSFDDSISSISLSALQLVVITKLISLLIVRVYGSKGLCIFTWTLSPVIACGSTCKCASSIFFRFPE